MAKASSYDLRIKAMKLVKADLPIILISADY